MISHCVTTAFNRSRCQDVGDLHHGPSFVDHIKADARNSDQGSGRSRPPKPLVIREEINAGNLDKNNFDNNFQFGQTHFALGRNKWRREPTLCGEAEALVMVEEVNGGQTRG